MVLKLAVPANAYLVLFEVAGCRPFVLVKVRGIEIQTVDLPFRVLAIRAADLSQQGVSKANIPG